MARHDPRMPEPPSRPPPGENAASPREGETLDDDDREGASGGTRTAAGTDYGDWVPGAGDGQVTPPRPDRADVEPGSGWGREAASLAGVDRQESLDPDTTDTLGASLSGPPAALTGSTGAADTGDAGAGAGAFGLGGGQHAREDGGGFAGSTGSGYGYAGSAGEGTGTSYAGSQGTTRTGGDAGSDRYRRIADEFARWRRVAQERSSSSSSSRGPAAPGSLDATLPTGTAADDLARRSAVPGMTTPDDGVPVQDLPRNLPS